MSLFRVVQSMPESIALWGQEGAVGMRCRQEFDGLAPRQRIDLAC